MQRILFSALAAVALAAPLATAAAQDGAARTELGAAPRPKVDKYAVEMSAPDYGAYVGSSIPLTAVVSRNGTVSPDLPVVWESSDARIAWVTPAGQLSFIKEGRVTITARYMTGEAKHVFAVKENPVRDVDFARGTRGTVVVGDTLRVSAVAKDDDRKPVADAHLTFAVASRGAARAEASIDDRGAFVAKQPGVYTVVAEFGGHAATMVVAVQGAEQGAAYAAGGPVSTTGKKLKIDAGDYFSYAGTSIPLVARAGDASTVESAELASQIFWSSSDTTVAVVDQRGTVHFLTNGKVKITARWGDAQATESFNVEKNPVKRMVLRSNAKDVRTGEEVKLSTEIWGLGGYKIRNLRVTYAVVGGVDGARISENGVFTANHPGTFTIVAEAGGLGEQLTFVVRENGVLKK